MPHKLGEDEILFWNKSGTNCLQPVLWVWGRQSRGDSSFTMRMIREIGYMLEESEAMVGDSFNQSIQRLGSS